MAEQGIVTRFAAAGAVQVATLAKATGAKAPREPQTHDYTCPKRGWGHDFTVMEIFDGGKTLDLSGWGRGICEGDYLILPSKEGSTRYQVSSIRYMDDPTDQWFAKANFAPRR